MLCTLIWLPISVAILLLLAAPRDGRLARMVALLPMMVVLILSFVVLQHTPADSGYAWEIRYPWFPDLGISYHLGVNRLSAILILLTALVGVAAIAVSNVTRHAAAFYALGLIIVGGMIGAFASLDLFFLYIFHEFGLIPTFILIGIWGGQGRSHAAMKITLYLGLGSLILLVGFIALYLSAQIQSFDLVDLKAKLASNPINPDLQQGIFSLLLLGFGILVSLVPFHTWAPSGYGEAPSMASMLHAGVIKKFGLYGLVAVAAPLLPEGFEFWKPWIVTLAIGNLIYAGYVALKQSDLRYMLAYASISHMGYAFLALAAGTPIAMQGFTLFLFAHGLAAATGFAVVGCCRDLTGTSQISELGGLARRIPFAATVFTLAALAASGLPGFANFPAELMIFLGSFHVYPQATILGLWTVFISAIYFLRAIRNTFLGPLSSAHEQVVDVDWGRRWALILLLGALLFTGFMPQSILGRTGATPSSVALRY